MTDQILYGRFDTPDESRPFVAHGHADALTLDGHTVLRGTFEPGWRWTSDVKPIAGTDLCETAHFGYVLSGSMTVIPKDGEGITASAGDLVQIAPGHDAYVTGEEPCVFLDWGTIANYAKG